MAPDFRHHLGEELSIAPTPERSIEVDKMNPFCTLIYPCPSRIDGRSVLSLTPSPALYEADGLAGCDVYSGKEDESLSDGHSRNPTLCRTAT